MHPFHAIFLSLLTIGSAVLAQGEEQNNLWIMWEKIVRDDPKSHFRSHILLDVPTGEAQRFFQDMTYPAQKYGSADLVHETSPLCLTPQKPTAPQITTNGLELVDKITTLRGLTGVYVDFRAVRGPRTFDGDFGKSVHDYVVAQLTAAKIPLLTKEQLDITPGHPVLSFRYSVEVAGCKPWSVSLGLKQTVVLTRAPHMMLETSTWSASARQSEEDIDFGAMEALRDVVAAFITDYTKANALELKTSN